MESAEPIKEDIFEHLHHIVKGKTAKTVHFEDGRSMRVDVRTAKAVLEVHESLNEENKNKIADVAGKSKEHFGKVVDFAWKHTKG